MKNLKTFALSALSLFGFAACQQVEIAPDVTPEATHTVTFIAGAPETKTTVDITDGKTAKFAWTTADEKRIAIYENGDPAKTVACGLDKGKMTIMAEFEGDPTGNETYVAVVNSSNDGQIMTSAAYDEDADILVSKAVSSFEENALVQLRFKREVAIAKMTLKGLDPGEVVNHVTVSSTADIAGIYGVDGWSSTKTSLDIYSELAINGKSGYSIEASNTGEAVVWFTCIPQDAATLTVQVEAADGHIYTKTFSKPITLNRGDVTSFGVALEKKGWFLVEDAGSPLAAGDVIVIVAADSNVALSTTQNDNNRGQQAITKNANNTVTIGNNVQRLTLGAGTVPGTFSLSTGSGYLYAASSTKNYLRTQTELDANSSWTITIADNIATIKANGNYSNNWLRYNSSNKIFSCYGSGQGDVQIYRLMNDTRAAQSISYSAKTGSIDKYTLVKDIPTLDESGVKTTVSYTSSDETVATVSNTGEITPLKAGTTTITAIAAASAEYREAKASFVLTVTDSTPYLTISASKTSVEAAGEIVTITVDTNVGNWNATSDNAAFEVGEPSGNTVKVTVSKNTDASERKATITVKAGNLSKTITLTQKAEGAKIWTYALSGSNDPKLYEGNPATVNGATWSITMGDKVGSPSANGTPTKYSGIFGWKWGDSSSKYWSSYTLSTDYFASKSVKSVTVKFLNNGKKSATMVVKQGETTIGTAKQTFGTTWTDLTANTTQGTGGTLTINYSVAQASYIHSITVEYYD